METLITPARRADQLRDRIENDIVTGALPPGVRLDEQELAARFGVSRTPIREAIAQLAAAGLVTSRPGRGAFVAAFGVRDIVERFEVMAALEGMCGRLAARRITEAGRAALIETHEACRRAAADGDPDPYYYENERFHTAIYDAGRNVFLAEQAQHLRRRLKPFRRLQLRLPNRVAQSLAEHDGIVAAILAGAADEAERRLKDHILIQGERLTDFVATFETAHHPQAGPQAGNG